MNKWLIPVAAMSVAMLALMSGASEVPANLAPSPAPEQPIPFSHKKHVAMGLPCTGCHTNPDSGTQMGFPSTQTCMGCHSGIATDKPSIIKLTELSKAAGDIPWVRVYELTPGVAWDHRTHLRAGMQCVMCHGQVAEIEQMRKVTSITAMASCIGCHQRHRAKISCHTCHGWPTDSATASSSAAAP
jgi:hypothetical protein